MKRYKLLNNVLGWVVFVIAAVTYILTLESTASFWDCGEFIASGYKLEVGHPPGNPIFMLTARSFANFASSPSEVAYMVNLMSGLLSAATILLLLLDDHPFGANESVFVGNWRDWRSTISLGAV